MNLVPGTKYLVPSTWYQVLGTKYSVPSTCYQVLGTKYSVPSTRYHVLGIKYQVLDTKYLVPSTWYPVLGTKYLVPGTWCQVLGTKYLVPSTWYQVLGTKYLVPSTWYQVLGTKYLATFRKRATGHIHTVRAQRHARLQPRTVRAARAPKFIARRSYYGPSGRDMGRLVALWPCKEPQSHYGPSGRVMDHRVALGTSVGGGGFPPWALLACLGPISLLWAKMFSGCRRCMGRRASALYACTAA